MRRMSSVVLSALLAAGLAPLGAHAATAQVRFVDPEKFADAGPDPRAREDVQRGLAAHLQALAGALPASQSLEIEVLDIDLAGELKPLHRAWADVRVMRGTADWPHIRLRFTLRDAGQVVSSGEAQVADMNYLMSRHFPAARDDDALRYEKRMLTGWFNERFGVRAQSASR